MAAAPDAMAQVEETIQFPSIESAIALAGPHEQNLKTLAQQTGAQLVMRGQDLYVSGEDRCVRRCLELVRSLQPYWREGSPISQADLQTALQAQDTERWADYHELQQDVLARTRRGDVIRAKTFQQQAYVRAIQQHDVTFCTGPAGTGKTFLAAVLAVQALLLQRPGFAKVSSVFLQQIKQPPVVRAQQLDGVANHGNEASIGLQRQDAVQDLVKVDVAD